MHFNPYNLYVEYIGTVPELMHLASEGKPTFSDSDTDERKTNENLTSSSSGTSRPTSTKENGQSCNENGKTYYINYTFSYCHS